MSLKGIFIPASFLKKKKKKQAKNTSKKKKKICQTDYCCLKKFMNCNYRFAKFQNDHMMEEKAFK